MEEENGAETSGQSQEQARQTGATLILLFKIVQCNVSVEGRTVG